MYNAQLFRFSGNDIQRLNCQTAASEKMLRHVLKKNLNSVFSITLLCKEYPTGRTHRGFIDTLGLDENYCPVIIEYKRKFNENIITQGLFYLDWLFDHKAEFIQIVKRKLGEETANLIEFSGTRLICVASFFSRFDERAIMQINRNIELIKYEFFNDDLVLLQNISNFVSPIAGETEPADDSDPEQPGMPQAMQSRLNNMTPQTEQLYFALIAFGEELGADVSLKFLKHYIAMQTDKNFTCLQPAKSFVKLWLNLEPEETPLEEGFSRNVRDIGHHASGNVEIDVHNLEDFEKAKPLIRLAYEKAGGRETISE